MILFPTYLTLPTCNIHSWLKPLKWKEPKFILFLQELLQVFETLEHQSYMLGRYREGRQSTGESNLAHNLRNDNIVPADNTIIADNVSNDKSKTNESVKPPGVDVEDDSDEDLSYLL